MKLDPISHHIEKAIPNTARIELWKTWRLLILPFGLVWFYMPLEAQETKGKINE